MNMTSELDKLYSTGPWTKRFSSVHEVFHNHLEVTGTRSLVVQRQIPCKLNLPYGKGARQKYDLFGIDLDDDAPIFIHVHGGYWQKPEITHSNQNYIAEVLYKNQIKSIFVGYDLCPSSTVTEIVQSIETAFEEFLQYAKKHKTKGIFLCGHSAGAQIISMLHTNYITYLPNEDKQLFKDVFLISGLYDLVPLIQTCYNKALRLDEKEARQVSPLYHKISSRCGNFFVVVGENDSPAFHEQSKRYYQRLRHWGVSARFLLITEVDHFDIVEKLGDENYELTKLVVNSIRKYL